MNRPWGAVGVPKEYQADKHIHALQKDKHIIKAKIEQHNLSSVVLRILEPRSLQSENPFLKFHFGYYINQDSQKKKNQSEGHLCIMSFSVFIYLEI